MENRKFYIGDLVHCETSGSIIGYLCGLSLHKGIVEYAYSDAFGGTDYSQLSILWLDENDNPLFSSAWYTDYLFTLIDDKHREENIQKIAKCNKSDGDGTPIYMNPELAKMLGYTSIHTYESAGKGEGSVKI